jgi:hypothetical protein
LDANAFLEAFPALCFGLHRIRRFGRCHSIHHQYLGQVTPYRLKKRKSEAERRRAQKANKAKVPVGSGPKRVKRKTWEEALDIRLYSLDHQSYPRLFYWRRVKMLRPPPPPARPGNFTAPICKDESKLKFNLTADDVILDPDFI